MVGYVHRLLLQEMDSANKPIIIEWLCSGPSQVYIVKELLLRI